MSRKIENIIGKKFGRLTIKEEIPSFIKRGGRCIIAVCECGVEKGYELGKLLYGHTRSCGSHRKGNTNVVHGLSKHPLHKVWDNMKTRCYNKNYHEFHNYGGRGVIVCDEWLNDFKAFSEWAINNGWRKDLDIDKDIKSDGLLYSPETCCFVTEKVNNNHTRKNRMISYNGEIMSMSDLSEKYNVNYYLLRKRLSTGWSVEAAINKPSRKLKLKPKRQFIDYSFGHFKQPQVAA